MHIIISWMHTCLCVLCIYMTAYILCLCSMKDLHVFTLFCNPIIRMKLPRIILSDYIFMHGLSYWWGLTCFRWTPLLVWLWIKETERWEKSSDGLNPLLNILKNVVWGRITLCKSKTANGQTGKKTNQMQKWATIWSLQDSVGTDDCTIHRENYNGQYRIDVIWAPNIWSPDVNN